jgi:hypothetical protein
MRERSRRVGASGALVNAGGARLDGTVTVDANSSQFDSML